jgi:urease accessory protein
MVANSNKTLNIEAKSWCAELNLEFSATAEKTVLVKRDHKGPLAVQRPFYPERNVCHVYILHPPGGIVGGDKLAISVKASANSHALITTPAAGKFYRSERKEAIQTVDISVANDAILEWLPQETIIYQGAQVKSSVNVNLVSNASFIGWEILSLGRPASGEGFDSGMAELNWQIYYQQQPLFLERLLLDAKAFMARWGLQGYSACGTLFAFPANSESLRKVQELIGESQGRGVTLIDHLLICRGLDHRSDKLRVFFEQVWQLIRPQTAQRQACTPRIWAT